MAKRKDSKREEPEAEESADTFGDLLKPAIPDLIADLMRRAKTRTQAEFATDTPFDANDISRYIKGIHVPLKHLPALGKRAGLTVAETGWLLGSHLVTVYDAQRPDRDVKQPGEIREQEGVYDGERNLERELDAVLALDFTPLAPARLMARNRERTRLRKTCDEAQSGYARETGLLFDLLRDFRKRSEEELRQARDDRT